MTEKAFICPKCGNVGFIQEKFRTYCKKCGYTMDSNTLMLAYQELEKEDGVNDSH